MIPIKFKCKNCTYISNLEDIDEDLFNSYYSELEVACEDIHYSAHDVLLFGSDDISRVSPDDDKENFRWYAPNSRADALIPFDYECPSCKKNLKLNIWCWFSVEYDKLQPWRAYYVEQLDDGWTIDVSNAILQENYGFYYGEEILRFLKRFFHRWAVLDYEIIVIIPFIDEEGWLSILRDVFAMHTSSFVGKIKTKLFLTRPAKYGRKLGKEGLNKMRKEHCYKCEKIWQTHEPPCFDGFCIWDKSHKIPIIGNIQSSKKNFHAKLVAGISLDGLVESVLTSYNFIEPESTSRIIPEYLVSRKISTNMHTINYSKMWIINLRPFW